jgi:hypothetical protein
LTGGARSDKVAPNVRHQGNPSYLVPKAIPVTSSSTADTAPSAADASRYEDARRAARGGTAGASRLAAQGRGDQRRQGDKLAGKAAGTRRIIVFAGGGWRGPSAGAGRSTANNPLRPSARACRSGGPAAWGSMPALSNGVILRALHLTGSSRLWMALKRLLLLRSGGQVSRRGRRN